MTETDATNRPMGMPEEYVPYLEKHRLYKLFKDMVRDLILNLPKDHLKFMKMYLDQRVVASIDVHRVIILFSPEVKEMMGDDILTRVVKDLIKDLGLSVLTRRYILDRYVKHDDYAPGCISPTLLSLVTKLLTHKDPVPQVGWLMFDHPCTMREAKCLQQDGVIPTVTLVVDLPPPVAPRPYNPYTPARSFFQQDFEGLKLMYKASLKNVFIEPHEDPELITSKCVNAVHACASGAQGSGQGINVLGAPGVYRVLLIGARGSGRTTHARMLAKHFGLVYCMFCLISEIYCAAIRREDELGAKLRMYGPSSQLKAEAVRRRLEEKDCLDMGWVLIGYPKNGADFEQLDSMKTPPNRIIMLNTDRETCMKRLQQRRMDWCTGEPVEENHPRASLHPRDADTKLENQLNYFFSEALAELRAAAGITAVEISSLDPIDQVHTKVLAAVMAAPLYDIEHAFKLRNVCAD